jgi:uncharacterized membrane protein (UPF0127 family)
MASFLGPILQSPDTAFRLVKAGAAQPIAAHVLTAFDSASRRTGLLKYDAMPPDSALIIAPCSSIHTVGMRFPIDVAFVARDGRVLKACGSIPRWRIALSLRAFAAIELAAGVLASAGVSAGDTVALES